MSVVRADYATFAPSGSVGYFDNISVSAVHPVTDANPGLLRKTNIISTITETTGSAYFDGNGDYFSVGTKSNADWAFGTDPFTVEHWIYWQSVEMGQLFVQEWAIILMLGTAI